MAGGKQNRDDGSRMSDNGMGENDFVSAEIVDSGAPQIPQNALPSSPPQPVEPPVQAPPFDRQQTSNGHAAHSQPTIQPIEPPPANFGQPDFGYSNLDPNLAVASQQTGIHLKLEFFPLAFLFFFCTPVVTINGKRNKLPWGTHFLELPPGGYYVEVFVPYMFWPECGKNAVEVEIQPGVSRLVGFNMPPWVFAKGMMSVN